MSTSTITSDTLTTNQPPDRSILKTPERITPAAAAEDEKFQAVARGNRSGTLKLPGIPSFANAHDERKWMKEHMAAAFRFFGKKGYNEGISGHISMRGMYLCVSSSSLPASHN